MFGLKRKPIIDFPDDKEWNFSLVEPEDAKTCLRYEFAREVQHPESYFSVFTKAELAPCSFEPVESVETVKPDDSEEFELRVKSAYSRVINTPILGEKELGLREVLSGMYFRHGDQSIRGYPADLAKTPWLELDESWQYLLTDYFEKHIVGFATFDFEQDRKSEEESPGARERLSKPGSRQILTFAIDWRENDPTLEHSFQKWLQKNRPTAFPSNPGLSRQSALDNLNSLSALRLRNRLSVEDAIRHTKAVCGKPLYAERSSWERAHRRATHLFKSIFPDAGEARSASKTSNRK